MAILWVLIAIVLGCCLIGFPFTYIYWKQADKWADTEAKRMKAERDRADDPSG